MIRRTAFSLLSLVALSGAGLSHEFWLEPEEFQVAPDAELRVAMKNGEGFVGTDLVWYDRRIARMEQLRAGTAAPVTGRPGDRPAVQIPARDTRAGLAVLVYQSTLSTLTYDDFDLVRRFAAHKDLPTLLPRHAERGLPRNGVREAYTRFCKTLIAVGEGTGSDRATGMETEFLALANPYVDDLSGGMPVRLLYRGAPRPDAQVEIFARAPDGQVTVTTTRTDAAGEARIAVAPGHAYQLDAVVLREPDAALAEEKNVMWETLWANMTFAVP
ncbi:DUF4198 domain-containing protein [Pseudooceanicola aestuarii]|uniref:DUF4198 domain-containing protein n=1 Tax=Pseudooceanicola aestuarii TaxID=2697319 RepID=UPI0013D84153|nr:DUF4198 domain-containing protein [Pseudooceanicola aestuarii]